MDNSPTQKAKMDKRKRTVKFAVAAALGLLALILAPYLIYKAYFREPKGGTPIIIKGFDDGNGGEVVTIEGSPSLNTNAPTPDGLNHHVRLDSLARLYVLNADESCVDFVFGKPSSQQITIVVNGAKEIVLLHSVQSTPNTVLDLLFNDPDTYQKSGGYYTRGQPGAIQKVIIVPGGGTTCTNKEEEGIDCPTEFIGSKPITIGVNYRDGTRCTR